MWFMGPLHLQTVLGSVIGQWLHGSGRVDIYRKCGISTTGIIEGFLSGSDVKRCRYAHLVALASFVKL